MNMCKWLYCYILNKCNLSKENFIVENDGSYKQILTDINVQ